MKKAEFLARKAQAKKDNIEKYERDLAENADTLFFDAQAEYNYSLNTYRKKYSVIIVDLVSRKRISVLYKELSNKVAGIMAAKENGKSKHVKNPLYGFIVV